jgi:hypothetical protein
VQSSAKRYNFLLGTWWAHENAGHQQADDRRKPILKKSMTAKMRFTKTEILEAFAREEKSYRLGLLCTHWIRDVERYTPTAAELASGLQMQVNGEWISDSDLAVLLDDPMKRELLSSDFLLTYLHTLIRAPFELL